VRRTGRLTFHPFTSPPALATSTTVTRVGGTGPTMVGIPKRLLADGGIGDEDAVYARLMEVHAGLSPAASEILNARLVLILANHIADQSVLAAAIAQAMDGLDPSARRPRGGE